jgi:MoaA/NifB/PqqE/SkfB family radical SAM enzyme
MSIPITQSQRYLQQTEDEIARISASGEPVYIFGAGRAGWYIIKVLQHFGINVEGIIDNNEEKLGVYADIPVQKPISILADNPKVTVLLGIFRPDSAKSVQEQLEVHDKAGVSHMMDAILFTYYHSVVKRDCDMDILAESIAVLFENYKEPVDHYGYTQSGYFVSPFVTSNITQKCSIDCQDCGQLIPYYKTPVNFSAEAIAADIKQYAKAFDVVPEMSLHGGEPLMNKQLADICREVSKIPNIVFVSFLTNGTIVPSTKILEALSDCGAVLQQSDYKELSPKQSQIFELCAEYGVYSDIVYTTASGNWMRMPETKKHNRTKELNDEIYSECVNSKLCCQIMDGELHRCPYSMHSTRIGRIPKIEDDHVKLLRTSNEDASLVDDVRAFLTRKDALSACDYCDPRNSVEVKPAIQIVKFKTKQKRA